MQPRPLVHGQSRARAIARIRPLLKKFALALACAALISIFLFALVHLNEAVRNWGAGN